MQENQQNNLDWVSGLTWIYEIAGKEVGNGSGLKLTESHLLESGLAFTGYELLEFIANKSAPQPFSLVAFVEEEIIERIESGELFVLESPTPTNEMGRYRFNIKHPANIEGSKV